MGGDPVTTKPAVLMVDEEDEGKVVVNGMEFTISEQLIAKVFGLPMEGEAISRDKTNQAGQLTKFLKDEETFCWLQSGIAQESLPKPWDRVAGQIMKYLTLEGKFRKTFGYHIAILNSIKNEERINILLLLLKSLEKSVKAAKSGKGRVPLHQGLVKLLYQYNKDKGGTSAVISDSEEETDSRGEEVPLVVSKKDDGRNLKQKPPPRVLATNLAKCSRRSSRLQKKLAEKTKIVDYVEKEESDAGNAVDVGKSAKDLGPGISDKGLVKEPGETHNVVEELRCHLKILNGLGGSLTSTCACINLLALETTNYLKEVVNKLKEMSSTSTKPQSSSMNKEKE
eukprot:Gb_17708 [translate_table: standard]